MEMREFVTLRIRVRTPALHALGEFLGFGVIIQRLLPWFGAQTPIAHYHSLSAHSCWPRGTKMHFGLGGLGCGPL